MEESRAMPPASHSGAPAELPTGALLDALFANAPMGLAVWDRELRYQHINAVLAAINGLPVDAHIGRRLPEVLPAIGPQVEDTLRRVLRTERPERDLDVVGETPSAPGVTRHWLASFFPIRQDGAGVVGVTGFVVEVTGERQAARRADEALRHSAFVDAELRALVAASPLGVAFLDRDMRYRRVNETLARMNGRPLDEHFGASIEEVLGEAAAGLRAAIQGVMDSGQALEIGVERPAPGDPAVSRSYEATFFPVVDGEDRLLGVGGVVRDVTERKQLEVEQSRLLREALLARAQAEAAQVRADAAREEAENVGAQAELGRARMAFLVRAGRRMAESMDWEATLRAVVRSAVPTIADWSSLTVLEPNGLLRVVAVAHDDPEQEARAWQLARRYPPTMDAQRGSAQVIRTGQPEIIADIDPGAVAAVATDSEHRALLETLDVRHAVIAPLKTPAGVVGALSFMLGESGRRFSPEDVDLIVSLAARAALHIQNSRLYTERSHIARTLQASLRPRELAAIPGAEIAARFQAAGDQNVVGGDFYDLFRTGDGVWTLIVGDVSGKGPEAAAVTALARHTLRTASMLHDDPSANLALLNRALHGDSPTASFCTVFYARVCPGEAGLAFRFAVGGHPEPLLQRADGRVEAIRSGRGPLVGAVPEVTFDEATLTLAPGELLLIYTDGVTEVRTSDIDLGERELRATLAAHAGASADEVVAAVEQRALELQDGEPRDDMALVAIRATGGGWGYG